MWVQVLGKSNKVLLTVEPFHGPSNVHIKISRREDPESHHQRKLIHVGGRGDVNCCDFSFHEQHSMFPVAITITIYKLKIKQGLSFEGFSGQSACCTSMWT